MQESGGEQRYPVTHFLQQFFRFCPAVLAAVFFTLTPGVHAAPLPLPEAERLAAMETLDLDAAFTAVATTIRYEPYPGVLRGPLGTVAARGGNALDQSLLLAHLLRGKGYRVRFVRGTLEGANLVSIVRGMYPPQLPVYTTPAEYAPFDPAADPGLLQAAAEHTWLELDQGGGNWLPLDPSFPRAQIGEAYARPTAYHDQLDAAHYQELSLSLHEETADGSSRELGRHEARTADLGLQPLSLVILGAPIMQAAEKAAQRSGGDLMSGALAGEEPQAEQPATDLSPQRIGTRYRAVLQSASLPIGMGSSEVMDSEPGNAIRRQWLAFELKVPGLAPRRIERDLFVHDAPGNAGAAPPVYRRYALAVLPGALNPQSVTGLAKALDPRTGRTRIDAAAKAGASADIAALDEEFGLNALHLAALSIGAESSELTRRTAYNSGVSVVQSLPRIIIVSIEGSQEQPAAMRVAIDLRFDQVDAWPYPGRAQRAAEHFQSARGIENSLLEADFLQRLLGADAVANTARLVREVSGGQAAMRVFGPGQEAEAAALPGLSPYAQRLIAASLGAGREVIIPPQAVDLAGRPRYGWWERDPASGRLVGVMDDGLHQAMTEYSFNTAEIGTNDDSGMVIGAMVGATGTCILIAAKILEHGVITPQAIAEIEKSIAHLQCLSCPEAEAKVGAGVSTSGTCWSISKGVAAGVGAKTTSFCEKYTKGMSCAAGVILNHLKGAPVLGHAQTKSGISADTKLPCQADDGGGS